MTDSAQTTTTGWIARPFVAFFVRVLAHGIPIVASLVAARFLSAMLPAAPSAAWAGGRWISVVVVSTIVLLLVERVTRRLLPLATLLKLTLAFPDHTPSRFRIAIRVGTTRQLRRKLERAEYGDLGDTPSEAAERLLELVGQLSLHDRLTRGHSERVRAYVHMIGRDMGMTGTELDRLRWAGLLHDVGKIMVPEEILNKPGRLTDEEFETIKTHPMAGKQFVEPLADWLGESARAVWEHHERVDGNGYPQGLAGTDIALASRIVCVADAFDVMTSRRSYKEPLSAIAARAELTRCSGTQFDPVVVRTFINVSIGRFDTKTAPFSWLTQLTFFPRTFITQAGATFATGAAIALGTLTGTASALADQGSTPDGPSDVVPPRSLVDEDVADQPIQRASPSSNGTIDVSNGPADTTSNPPADNTGGPDTDQTPVGQPEAPPDVPAPTTIPPIEPDVTTPDVTIPDVTVPDLTIPTSTIPDVTIPDVTIPDVTIPDVTIPDVTIPDLTIPTSTIPDVTIPDVTIPDVTIPDITIPNVTVPNVTIPDVTIPTGTVATTIPNVTIPVPEPTVPDVTTPTVPATTLPPATVPVLPF